MFALGSLQRRQEGSSIPRTPIYNIRMTLSARDKLRGQVEEILMGDILAHVVIRVGDNLIESVITRRSAEELKLKKGDTVSAVVKATEVMILKD
jgi:molybdopterin-binding protein